MNISILMMVLKVAVWTKARSHTHNRDDKIVGGSTVTDTRTAPYMINIQLQDPLSQDLTWGPYAAGTIFSPLYVITACHNLAETDDAGNIVSVADAYPLKYWRFVAGTANLAKMDKSHQFRTPVSLTRHPKCQLEKNHAPYLRNDVALAKMTEPFKIDDFVKPVEFFGFNQQVFEDGVHKIISSQNSTSGHGVPQCKVAGWGSTKRITILEQFGFTTVLPQLDSSEDPGTDNNTENGGTDQLKNLIVYPMYDDECFPKMIDALKAGLGPYARLVDEAAIEEYRQVLLKQLCALSKFSNESTCYGDSGSGVVCNGFYIGVTSWGVGCGGGAPEVFQSLPQLLDWLKKEVCTVRSCQDAQNIHGKCDPPDPDYLKKCQTPVNAQRMTTTVRFTIGLAYLASLIH